MQNPSDSDASDAFANDVAPRRRSKLRTFAAAIVAGTLLLIAATLVLIAISRRESLPPINLTDVDAAAQRWAEHGPADYDLDLEQTGINPGRVHVEVRHGQVTAMTLNGHPTRQHLWDDWSVPGLLAIIRHDVEVCMPDLNKKAQQKAAEENQNGPSEFVAPILPRGQFDPRDGHPLQYHRITPTGADANWRVVNFKPE
jgi:hypothetical protein